MFSLKITSGKDNSPESDYKKTINGILSYALDVVGFKNTRMLSDNISVEMVSGNEAADKKDGDILVELVVRKTILINKEHLSDKSSLDRHINEIKNFCDKAKSIEDLKYMPINMR